MLGSYTRAVGRFLDLVGAISIKVARTGFLALGHAPLGYFPSFPSLFEWLNPCHFKRKYHKLTQPYSEEFSEAFLALAGFNDAIL